MKQPSYKIYPSLLDKFDKYLRADEEVENFWNIDNGNGKFDRPSRGYKSESKVTGNLAFIRNRTII